MTKEHSSKASSATTPNYQQMPSFQISTTNNSEKLANHTETNSN